MRPKYEREALKHYNNFYNAMEILEYIKNRSVPTIGLLTRAYGQSKAGLIKEIFENYFDVNFKPGLKVREHDYTAPDEVFSARTNLEDDEHYQKIHSSILYNIVPDIDDLRKFYGPYSESVKQIFEQYIYLQLKRKCNISSASHLNRVGGMAIELNFNLAGCFEYGAIAAMHDAIEDLLPLVRDSRKKKYDIENYKDFLDEYIPFVLQPFVKTLTNHYDLILGYVIRFLKDKDRFINVSNILEVLEMLMAKRLEEIEVYIEELYLVLLKADFDEDLDLIDQIKWKCYKDLYLKGIAGKSIKDGNYRLFEIKGIDLSDNFHGKDSLSIDGKIRSLNKNIIWGKLGYGFQSTWTPLNNHIRESIEEVYISAENIILRDLFEPQSTLDFITATLIKFSLLEEIFYT